jgi:hypothetical protein
VIRPVTEEFQGAANENALPAGRAGRTSRTNDPALPALSWVNNRPNGGGGRQHADKS